MPTVLVSSYVVFIMLSLDLFPEKKNANLTLFRFRCLILDCAVVESIIFVSVKKQSKQTDSL